MSAARVIPTARLFRSSTTTIFARMRFDRRGEMFSCAPLVVRGYATASETPTTKDNATTKADKMRAIEEVDLDNPQLRMYIKTQTEDPGILGSDIFYFSLFILIFS